MHSIERRSSWRADRWPRLGWIAFVSVAAFAGCSSHRKGAGGRPVAGTGSFTITPGSGRVTTEAGGTTSFTVVLDLPPTADVVVGVASSDPAEGYVSVDSLTFTPVDWNAPKQVVVTGVDDPFVDGDVAYSIVLSPAVSTDVQYSGVDPDDVSVVNVGDDVAGATVHPASGLATDENGSTASFTIVLDAAPAADVTIPIASSDPTLGTVAPNSIVFTSVNWHVAQTVTVTGQDDAPPVAGPPAPYTIVAGPATSADPAFDGLATPGIAVENDDNDAAAITVTPTAGLVTTESGGSDQFGVFLDTAPTAPVKLNLATFDPTEVRIATGSGAPAASLSLDFDGTNWSVPQVVRVVGVDDPGPVVDGDVSGSITIAVDPSSAPEYLSVAAPSPQVTNDDDDVAGFRVEPLDGTTTEESPAVDHFTVRLQTIPSSGVTISVASLDPTEGTVSPATLGFLPDATALEPQTVTVAPVDDSIVDGAVVYTIALGADGTTADADYRDLVPPSITATNHDDEVAGITVVEQGVLTSELGEAGRFFVHLDSIPHAPVTVTFTGLDATEGTLSPSVLTFPADGSALVPQMVTVTGIDDGILDGDVTYTLTGTPSGADSVYSGLPPIAVTVVSIDRDDPSNPPGAGVELATSGALDSSPPKAWDDDHVVEPCVQEIAGTFVLWYEGSNDAGQLHEGVGQATSATAPGPFAKDPANPVLVHSGKRSQIDQSGVGAPCVLFDGTSYRMWFSCREKGDRRLQIACATAPDGVAWTKLTDGPGGPTAAVLAPTPGAFDAVGVTSPHVLFDAGVYKMWYEGVDGPGVPRIGFATSPDGVTWTKQGAAVLQEGPPGSFDAKGVGSPCVILHGSTYVMYYTGMGVDRRHRIGIATSADGIQWTKFFDDPIVDLGPQGSFDETDVRDPWVLEIGPVLHLWFTGRDASGKYHIGHTQAP